MTAAAPAAPVALVTGSSSGIGAATARALGAAGYRVAVNSSASVEAGEAVAADIDSAVYLRADVGEETGCKDLVDATIGTFGRLDVLVNNAGTTVVIPHRDLDAIDDDTFVRLLRVNLLGPWHLTCAALPHLKTAGDGVVVNVTSLAGIRPGGSSIPYAVSKAALNHLTRLLANVTGPAVRVNAVAPGLVLTPWTADWDALHGLVQRRSPLGRSATPEDIAEVILGVVRFRHMTGEVLLVDGGSALR